MTFAIDMPEAQLEELRKVASSLGVPAEELACAILKAHLAGPREDFETAADYVLGKNSELYRRLG